MMVHDLIEIWRLPRVTVNLMLEKTENNDPFYAREVQKFYAESQSRHPKLFFAKRNEWGYALCKMPDDLETYVKSLESSARNNYRKAQRSGFSTKRLDFNAYLEDVREIQRSTPIRQGLLPREIREGLVQPITDPPSRTAYHDYPYYGVFRGGKVVAYASCLIAGEVCITHDFYGHAAYLKDGVVSMLVMDMVEQILTSFPSVKYFGFGTYYGASESMRRFKRKFHFYPHHVTWQLASPMAVTARLDCVSV